MLFHTLAFNARTDRRFRRTVRIALLLLAGQMFPAAGATAEDRIGSGSVTVSDGQIYDNVYGDRSEGGDAAKEAISDEMNAAMLQYMPLRGPVSFGGGVSMADVQKLVDRLNAMEK